MVELGSIIVNWTTKFKESIKLDDKNTLTIENLEGQVQGLNQQVRAVSVIKTTKAETKGAFDAQIGFMVDPEHLPKLIKSLTLINEQLSK